MHGLFSEICEAQKRKTIEAHIQKHNKPMPLFEKKVKAVFDKCSFLKSSGKVFEHTELYPQVDSARYSSGSNFSRAHFDYLRENYNKVKALVQARLDKLQGLPNGIIQPVQISKHFMKTWSSLTSKLNRPDDQQGQALQLE